MIFIALNQLNLIPIFFFVNKFVIVEKGVKAYAAVIEKKLVTLWWSHHIAHLFWIRFVRKWMRNCILLPKCTGNNHKHVEVTDKLTPNHVTARKRAVQVRPAGWWRHYQLTKLNLWRNHSLCQVKVWIHQLTYITTNNM